MNKTVSIKKEHCMLGLVITVDHTAWKMRHYKMLLIQKTVHMHPFRSELETFFLIRVKVMTLSQTNFQDQEAQILKLLLLQNANGLERCRLEAVHRLLANCQDSLLKFQMFC